MKEIHLIERINRVRRLPGTSGEWESGNWTVSKETAAELVGGAIFLHSAQDVPSHFGGIILGFDVLPPGGPAAGKVVFRFRAGKEQIGVISRGGWGMEKKLVRIGREKGGSDVPLSPISADGFRDYFYGKFPSQLATITFERPRDIVREIFDLHGTAFFGGPQWENAEADLAKIPDADRVSFVLSLFMITLTDQAIFTYEAEAYPQWRARTNFPKFGWTYSSPHFENPYHILWAPERDGLVRAESILLLMRDFVDFYLAQVGTMIAGYGLDIIPEELVASILQDSSASFDEGRIAPAFRAVLAERFTQGNAR